MAARLRAEQGWVCCYCGGSIGPTRDHIEHFRPLQSTPAFRHLTYAWGNLLASCQSGQLRREPRHCGAAKRRVV